MNSWYVFFVSFWLLCGHAMTALAIASPQQHASKPPTKEQPKTSLLAAKPVAKIPAETAKKTFKIPIKPPTAAQENERNLPLIIEEMAMQRAWMYSAVFPGLGQAYNKHYGRIPVIYTVFAGLGWGAIYNHNAYMEVKHKLLKHRNMFYSLKNHVDYYRKTRDLFIIFTALWYIANIFDAYVGASLKTFDLSDDIGLKVQPSVALPTTHHSPTVDLSVTISLRK